MTTTDVNRFKGSSTAPAWWFGAPLFGILLGFLANRFFPESVGPLSAAIYRLSGFGAASATVSPDVTRFLAPLVGMLVAVAALGAWRLVRRVTRTR